MRDLPFIRNVRFRIPGLETLWIYQQERFPLIPNGLLIAAMTVSGVCYSSLVTGTADLPDLPALIAGFSTVLLVFLLMRFFDEFKDAAEDALYRPYRPVQRGLISLTEIGWLAALSIAIQLALQWIWLPGQLPWLLLIYGYLALMTCEFGVGRWLKQHPLVYAVSHMLIMPLIGLYVTGLDWHRGGPPPAGIFPFLALLFCTGFVIEIGRKVRAPESEEAGVDTYSGLFGPVRAAWLWLGALTGTVVCAVALGTLGIWAVSVLAAGLFCGLVLGWRYTRRPDVPRATLIETYSGIWSLLLFATITASAYIQSTLEAW